MPISLGGSTIGIGLAVRLNNQFSANANRINNQFSSLYNNANRVMKQNLVAARQVGVAMTIAGAAGLGFFRGAVNIAADFNYTMKGVQAATMASSDQMVKLHDQAIRVGMASKFTAQQIAQAMAELGKGGFEVMDIRKAIGGIANLGAAADMNIEGKEGAASIMSNILNTYSLAASQSSRVADILSMGAVKSSADVIDFAESIKYAGSALTISKVPLEDTIAMLGILANTGQKGSMAGVGLANMYLYLSKAVGPFRTKRQADALQMLGLDPKTLVDSTGKIKPIVDLMSLMVDKMETLSPVNRLAIADALMNVRGARAFVSLFRDPKIGKNMKEMLTAVREGSTGMADKMAKMRMDTMKGDMMILADTWDAFKVSIGETLEPIVRFGVQFASKVLRGIISFSKTPFGKPLIVLAAGLAAAVTIGGVLIVALTSIKLLTMTTGVTAANMGRSLVWAWNAAAAAATRYGLVASGVTWTGKGVFVQKGVKGFQKIPGMGASKGVGFFGKIISGLGSAGNMIVRIASGLKPVAGVLGGLAMVFTAMIGLKNIVKGVVYALGSMAQSVMWVVDFISNIGEGPIDAFNIASENFSKRNQHWRKQVGFEDMPINSFVKRGKSDPYENTIGLKERMAEIAAGIKQKPQKVVMNVDGKQIAEAVFKTQSEELSRLLQTKN